MAYFTLPLSNWLENRHLLFPTLKSYVFLNRFPMYIALHQIPHKNTNQQCNLTQFALLQVVERCETQKEREWWIPSELKWFNILLESTCSTIYTLLACQQGSEETEVLKCALRFSYFTLSLRIASGSSANCTATGFCWSPQFVESSRQSGFGAGNSLCILFTSV